MDESKRTKILAAVLFGVLTFMAVRPDRRLMQPITEAREELESADRRLEKERDRQTLVMEAENRIENGRDMSLPPNAADAQRLYQSWITNLAEQCKFAQLKVTPGRTENRPGQYVAVNVEVEAETDLEGISRFLFLFEQANLLHRVAGLEIQSTGSQGKPRMEITLTAEGMSVNGSPVKADVFARSHLPKPVTVDATEIQVAESADFPTKGAFLAQVGREMVKVTAVNGNTLTVERGQEGTKPAEHSADEYVQVFPLAPRRDTVKFEDYAGFLASSPFTKPAPERIYRPRLVVSDKTIAPGETVKMAVKAEDVNPDVGDAVLEMSDAADGMKFDSESNEFEWVTAKDMEPKKYEATFILTQKNNPDLKVEKKVGITLQLPNETPEVELPADAIVILGREFELEFKAEDDGPKDDLTFSLEGDVPSGLTVDGASLKWNPPKTFSPGDYTVTVKATDKGTPAKSVDKSMILKVQDDTAALTRFTGAVGRDGIPVVWFWNQIENKRPELKLGDRIEVAEIDAELTEISKRHILMADAKGIWRLRLGENLRQRELIEPAEETADEPAENDKAEAGSTAKDEETDTTDSKPATTQPQNPEAEKDAEVEKPQAVEAPVVKPAPAENPPKTETPAAE